ncbi:hypothetical protein C8Q76DRAFT_627213 [Earliella scabrosa]|nr:hypothetical protein C8Q76DRAFT_627213 [Earliella scabrosa]
MLDLANTILALVKYPLGLVLAFIIPGLLVVYVYGSAIDSFHAKTKSLCAVPVLSRIAYCSPPPLEQPNLPPALSDLTSLLTVQNVALDELAGQSTVGASLALNLKHAEIAVKDLVVAVQESNLTIRDTLADILLAFVSEARSASRRLYHVSAKINGFMDSIDVFNAYAYRLLSEGGSNRLRLEAATTLQHTFSSALESLSIKLEQIILDVARTSDALDALEERLSVIHRLCVRESFITTAARERLLWDLWAMFGGTYGDQLRDMQNRADVLTSIVNYRNLAVAYIAVTTQRLLAVDADLTELRGRVVESIMGSQEVPLEVQLASIDRTLGRLKGGLLEAKARPASGPGTAHVESGPATADVATPMVVED